MHQGFAVILKTLNKNIKKDLQSFNKSIKMSLSATAHTYIENSR